MKLQNLRLGCNDLDKARAFYDATFGALGVERTQMPPEYPIAMYKLPGGPNFAVGPTRDKQPATHANGGTIGFACDSAEKVKAFHDAGVANGGKTIEDPPGWREGGGARLYLSYLRDPYGNKICALHRG